jgi:hypothetical protein
MHKSQILMSAFLVTACCTFNAAAGEDVTTNDDEHYVIALKTDDFDLQETDISDLAVGDAKTVFTDGGKAIDLLRTDDGLEIYVDGVLQDNISMPHELDAADAGQHEIEIICASDEDCEKMVWVEADEDLDPGTLEDGEARHVIRREIRVECADGDDCAEQNVWIEDDNEPVAFDQADGEVHVLRLHEDGDETHEAEGEKVIVIRKKAERD